MLSTRSSVTLCYDRTYLLVEDRFGLTSITRLLAIVSTLPLCSKRVFTLLVLCYFVRAADEGVRMDYSK
jgi:hypothetical protein